MYKLYKVTGKRFLEATSQIHKIWKLMQDNITLPPRLPANFYMDAEGTMGYGVAPDGELISLWSLVRGQGVTLVKQAVANGATWLTCYDNGFLVHFYTRCGFDEVGREPNWVEGQPDVVRMAWRQ
jgi:hypothetical protein